MSSTYVVIDPLSGKRRVFFGYLYECRAESPHGCPYAFELPDGNHCTHPNSRTYDCGRRKKLTALL
jgi:hypothetical protein